MAVERLGQHDPPREDVGPGLVADAKRVAEAGGDRQRHPLALALEQGVGGDRRPHLDRGDAAAPRFRQDRPDAGDGCVLVALGIVRQQLADDEPPVGGAGDDVGEGAAPVDREGPGRAHGRVRRSKGRLTRPAAWDSQSAMDEKDELPEADDEADDSFEPIDDDAPLTAADFHNIAQKQILNAVFAVMAENKLEWALVAPFLEAAREVCIGDFQEGARIRLHTMRAEGDTWVEAEEAFLGISVGDRDGGEEWLSETYWLSDIATADGGREQVRAIVAALERTIAKLNLWLEQEAGGAAAAAPPADDS